MRTTVDLDKDILRTAKDLAREREQSLGRVLSDLVRQGLKSAPIMVEHGVIPTLLPIPGARPVTDQIIKDMLENEIQGHGFIIGCEHLKPYTVPCIISKTTFEICSRITPIPFPIEV